MYSCPFFSHPKSWKRNISSDSLEEKITMKTLCYFIPTKELNYKMRRPNFFKLQVSLHPGFRKQKTYLLLR